MLVMTSVPTAVLTTSEAAAHLGLSDQMVRIYVKRRILTPVRKMGNTFVFDALEIERFRMARQQTHELTPAQF